MANGSSGQAQDRPMGILGDKSKVYKGFEARWHSAMPHVFHVFHMHEGEKALYNGCIFIDKDDVTKGMKCRNCNEEVPKALLFTVATKKV